MSEITASLVKELRDRTNAGMMECKGALKETGGDIEAAIKHLRERGAIKAAKKADREAKEGLVLAHLDDSGKAGLLVEMNCETDFVAKNDNFKAFVQEFAADVSASGATDRDAALAVAKADGTLDDYLKSKVIELGENLQFRRMSRFDLDGSGLVSSYIHLGGKVGVLVEVGCENDATASADGFRELVKDLTLHIAAASPAGMTRDDVDGSLVESEREVFRKEMENSGKPAEIIEKIVDGKLGKFYSTVCLMEQGFIKDPGQTVTDLIAAKGKELGDTLSIRRFTRFGVGEA